MSNFKRMLLIISYVMQLGSSALSFRWVTFFVLGVFLGKSQISFSQLPVDPSVIHGNAAIEVVGGHMSVTNSPDTIINWQNFSIGEGNSVHFQQQDAASQVFNRVSGDDVSEIFGNLSSNGSVWLINPYGIFFGENARIDVSSLIVSTLNISNLDFLARNYHFNASEVDSGSVVNHGEIRTSLGGRVWMSGQQIHNHGLIESPQGEIVLAAGQSVEFIDSGAPNVVVRINAPENETVNLGEMVSINGTVDLHGSIVNQNGILRANSMASDASGNIVLQSVEALTLSPQSETRSDNGSIQLKANDIWQEGEIAAQAGDVRMQADRQIYLDGHVDASGLQDNGGRIYVETERLEGMANGALLASGQQGGHIRIIGTESVASSSTLSTFGDNQGGEIEVSGNSVILLNADINASGGVRGGSIHLGGGWQGKGDLLHAQEVIVGMGSEINVSGNDQGGEIVIWSSKNSEQHGLLQADHGGKVELSSKGNVLLTGDIQTGTTGEVLFDPKNLIITDDPPDNLTLARKVVSGSVNGNPELAAGDNFGTSIALDGDRMVIGAPGDDANGSDRGAVHLFTGMDSDNANGLTWEKKIISGAGAAGMQELNDSDFFGVAVALDGDHLAVGARGPLLAGNNQGAVHLFSGVGSDFSGLSWQKKIASGEGAAGMPVLTGLDFFGTALALDGDRLAVGASGDSITGSNRGAVHLFTGINADFSSLVYAGKISSGSGAINMPTLADTDFFGWSVALDGERLVVGAFGDSSTGSNRGAVHLFTDATANFSTLMYAGKIGSGSGAGNMPVLTDADFFGWSVALDGNHLAVGALGDNTNGNNRGAVHLFENDGADFSELTWIGKMASGIGAVNMPVLSDDSGFGWSLALNSNNLVVGALSDNGGESTVFLFNGIASLEENLSGLSFSDNPASDSYITPRTLASLLNAGTSVTLQANNDIQIQSPIMVESGVESGNLTLQSGRNILLEANVTTGNADFLAVAGDVNADMNFRESGVPKLVIANNTTLDVGSGVAVLASVDGDFINNNSDQAILTDAGGRWLIYAANPETSTEGFAAIQGSRLFGQPFVSGMIPEQAVDGNWFFYSTDSPVTVGTLTTDSLVQNVNAGYAGTLPVVNSVTQGKTIDITASQPFERGFDLNLAYQSFSTLDISRMSREEMLQLMHYRREYKDKIFADAIHKLELDPSLADVPVCARLDEMNSGLCRITSDQRDEYKEKVAEDTRAKRITHIRNIPQIERKYIVLFGIDHYADPLIPPLENAIFDAQVVGNTFADQLGYETHVIQNATRTDLVRTLNRLAVDLEVNDSIVIYYAGHGLMLEKTGHGYWIPSDASASDPETWISNKSVSEILAMIDSRQIAVISDSCYSGAFASEVKLKSQQLTRNLDDILNKKGVMAMTAGADEPVSDEGRDGHSIFAWYLIQTVRTVNTWDTGFNLFKEIQHKVSQSFPQTPQYGGIISAGHQEGGDYLFELRQ
ncbi:filamentous hemagglutinin N-terminal domain-containing protein [Nitrosomonas sp.]|uniref:two-partner secretion domain-containing protein n=1 Tax=Nitrosomonas sp. TaxID=42353 RepID=UPI0025F129A0|nr:filamentous hemagglutinin N-terminal domain-containing protein [Nitrosomonas sp.]